MLRCRPSEIGLTHDDIERVSQRIAARKAAAPSRPAAPLRTSILVPHLRATIRPGPERSRDDAVIHGGRGLALRSYMQAEYVSMRRSYANLRVPGSRPVLNRFAELPTYDSSSDSCSSSPPSSPTDENFKYSSDRTLRSDPFPPVHSRSSQRVAGGNLPIPLTTRGDHKSVVADPANAAGRRRAVLDISTSTDSESASIIRANCQRYRNPGTMAADPVRSSRSRDLRFDIAASTPNLGAGLHRYIHQEADTGFDYTERSSGSRSSSSDSAIAAATVDNRSPLELLHDSLMEQFAQSQSAVPPPITNPRLNRQRQSRVPRHAATPETMLPSMIHTVPERPEPGVPDRIRRRRELDNQENSEEAAMSVLVQEMAALQTQSQDSGEVMNTTPPRSSRISRFL